ALIDMMARLAGAGPDRPVPMRSTTKDVLLEGLKGAAEYGTASTLKARGVSALAKTGTVTMPSGAALGLVVALSPAEKPSRAAVVVAPGGAGADAASIAADLLSTPGTGTRTEAEGGQTIRVGHVLADGKTRVESMP